MLIRARTRARCVGVGLTNREMLRMIYTNISSISGRAMRDSACTRAAVCPLAGLSRGEPNPLRLHPGNRLPYSNAADGQ